MFKTSICILCGGKSKRFGSRKLFYKVNGKTILETVYNKLENHSDDIFLQTSNDVRLEFYNDLKNITTKIYKDIFNDIGPLGGIYSGLKRARYDKIFILAGDLPFIDELILLELNKYDSFQIIVPVWENGFIEPLCALYSKEILPIIENQLDKHDYKISNLFNTVNDSKNDRFRIKYLNIDRLIQNKRINPHCFKNVNTKEDLLT